MLTVTITQIFEISLLESELCKKWQTLVIIGEISLYIVHKLPVAVNHCTPTFTPEFF